MEKTPATERIARLLGTRDVPGTAEQLELLAIRLQELCALNGRDWVRRHRDRLLRQWAAAIDSDA
jgi:hypothetical protein